MNEHSLSRLYRRLTAQRVEIAEADAGELSAVADGTVDAARRETAAAKLAASARHADLARMLRALQPASVELSGQVRRRGSAHPQRSREARPQHHARRISHRPLRWVGGLAACLALTLGVVGVWHGDARRGNVDSAHHDSMASAQRPDRIFTSQDRIFAGNDGASHRESGGRDELFRGDFSGG
jgi:hypothetical protein